MYHITFNLRFLINYNVLSIVSILDILWLTEIFFYINFTESYYIKTLIKVYVFGSWLNYIKQIANKMN